MKTDLLIMGSHDPHDSIHLDYSYDPVGVALLISNKMQGIMGGHWGGRVGGWEKVNSGGGERGTDLLIKGSHPHDLRHPDYSYDPGEVLHTQQTPAHTRSLTPCYLQNSAIQYLLRLQH